MDKGTHFAIWLPLFITILSISLPTCLCHYQVYNDRFVPYNNFHRPNSHNHVPYNIFGTVNKMHGRYHDPRNLFSHKGNSVTPKWYHRQVDHPSYSPKVINVEDFGAKANGNDDSPAFMKAWEAACSYSMGAVLVVPKDRVYNLNPVTFSGPCKSQLTIVRIYGTIKASNDPSDYKDRRYWIVFENVNNLRVEGSGRFDGSGKIWWANSCKINKNLPCRDAPTAVTFMECNNLVVSSIWIQNSQQMHLKFERCVNVKALNLLVTAPGDSPNTDGIHVTATQNILIKNCVIRTGDDCISIVSGSENVRAMGITCGPGHGISIGSLGEGNSEAYVSNVMVDTATITGTSNGLRIKTWQGGRGFAKNIMFQNVIMKHVTNPIIIDQNYCDQDKPCPEQASAVQISNVQYRNIQGTSSTETAVKFDCSKNAPCRGISMENVILSQEEDEISKAACDNVKLITLGKVSPLCY